MMMFRPFVAAAALAALALAGCSSDPSTAQLLSRANLLDRSTPTPAPAFIAAFGTPAPRYAAAVESQPEAIAVFIRQTLSESSGVGTWIGPDGSMLLFDDGVLVGSRGFANDVMASDVSQSAALVQGLGTGYATRLMTVLDGEDRAVTRAFKCLVSPGGIDPVQIGSQRVPARTVTERCRGEVASFSNFYWVVPGSGAIIQSSQWAGPATGKISLRVVPNNPG